MTVVALFVSLFIATLSPCDTTCDTGGMPLCTSATAVRHAPIVTRGRHEGRHSLDTGGMPLTP